MTDNNILDFDSSSSNLMIADKGTRFVNHVVDTIVFLFIVFLHAMVLDGILGVIPEEGSPFLGIYFFVLYVSYHTLFEHFWGKTPGKVLTKTHVVTINGLRPTFGNLLIRNLCRLIPFNKISFLISKPGWHDNFSKTRVVYVN